MPKSNVFPRRQPWHRSLITLGLCTVLLAGYFCAAQTPVLLMPVPKPLYFTSTGSTPLAFGCVFTYAVNSTNPLATYTDDTGTVQNQNPVILSAAGTASIWIQAGLSYTIKVKSAGGTKCATGSTIYTVDGIGGGASTLTTIVTYSATPIFNIAAQNQLFKITLTGDAVSQPLTAVGIIPPGLVTWEITQDGSGSHLFTWPANSVGGCTIAPGAGITTLQHFIWDGSNAIATGPCVTGNGPEIRTGNIFDSGLTASSPVCTDANKQLISACNTQNGVTVNGTHINPGGSGDVNTGAAAHSLAINEGTGVNLAGVALGASQIAVGAAGADPTPSTLPTCTSSTIQWLTYSGTLPITCSGATISTGTSGSFRLGTLIFQWALGPQRGNSEGTDTTNLPVTCPTAVDNVQVSYYKQSPGTGADDAWYQIDSFTTSTVVTFKQSTGGTSDNSKPFVFVVCH
jgi:hypothetical protein